MSLSAELTRLFFRRWREGGIVDAIRMTASAARASWHRASHRRLFALPAHRYVAAAIDDRMFHIAHRHYLVRGLTFGERIACACTHYGFDSARMDDAFLRAVYSGDGIELWAEEREGVAYRMRLRANRELPHEGSVDIEWSADGISLGALGYSWVDASLFGAGADVESPVLLIVRNQSAHVDAPAAIAFRRHFPQHATRFLCLAAMAGIAQAHDRDAVVGIDHASQIAYDEAHDEGFRNSYTRLWQSFGGEVLPRFAFRLAVPLPLTALAHVKAHHRPRAIERRRLWSDITRRTCAAVRAHRI